MESNKRGEMQEDPIDRVKDSTSNQTLPLKHTRYEDDCQDILPYFLVEVLADCHGFSSSLSELQITANMNPPSVTKLAARYPYVFPLKDQNIKLAPKIRVCKAYCSSHGCRKRKLCHNLHICEKYVMENCEDPECMWGHEWNTGHNSSILKTFFIDLLPSRVLQALLRTKMCPLHCPVVCLNYNEGKCNLAICNSLHICLNFVLATAVGSKSLCLATCPLNHNVKSSTCLDILKKFGISTNETIKDISSEIISSEVAFWTRDTSNNHPGHDLSCLRNFGSLQPHNPQRTSVNHFVRLIKRKKIKQFLTNNHSCFRQLSTSFRQSPTVWDHHLEGETLVDAICYKSVENVCGYENFGCLRLHATSHYHWQVRELGGKWLNLRSNQVKCLERAFCNPNLNIAILPCLDPVILGPSIRLLFVLMGRDSWTADFSTMILTCPSASKILYIRRLQTEAAMGGNIASLHHMWYFLDTNNEWILFGKTDSTGDPTSITSFTSDQIEAMYIQNKYDIILYKNRRYSFTLDFLSMMQYNQTTGSFSRVLRRPQPHIPVEGVENLLRDWNILHGHRMQFVPLIAPSIEFTSVTDLLTRHLAISPVVVGIEKILNPHLYLSHQNRIKELTLTYGNLLTVDMRYLLCGVNPNNCMTICEENFDRRRHGIQGLFGKGIYFVTCFSEAARYSMPDTNGNRFMFVASVAVGTKILGNSSMLDPPFNPLTLLPYDSTVNDEQNPTTFVKYNKLDFYPEYLVTFK